MNLKNRPQTKKAIKGRSYASFVYAANYIHRTIIYASIRKELKLLLLGQSIITYRFLYAPSYMQKYMSIPYIPYSNVRRKRVNSPNLRWALTLNARERFTVLDLVNVVSIKINESIKHRYIRLT